MYPVQMGSRKMAGQHRPPAHLQKLVVIQPVLKTFRCPEVPKCHRRHETWKDFRTTIPLKIINGTLS